MREFINNNINFKILGRKNLIILLSGITLFILSKIIMKVSVFNLYAYTDIVIPIIFSLIGIYLFNLDCTSNLNEVILIYNKKKYNKVLLKRILEYMLFCVVMIFLITIVLYYNVDQKTLFMKMPKTVFSLFIKTIPNTIFLISFLLFMLKVSKNSIVTAGAFAAFLFQEIGASGSYTYPFNLFINSNSLTKFTESLFIFNRFAIIILSIIMIYYVVKKVNK